MQQLLGDKAASTFIRELFLKRMVLDSTADAVSLEELATIADEAMDVAAPFTAAVSTPQITSDLELLRSEVKDVVSYLHSRKFANPHAPLVHTPLSTLTCAGTTNDLVKMPASADHLVPGRETVDSSS